MSAYDSVALVLSGGNALGAYQAGAYQALAEHGIEPDWIAAASAGAINGSIICGNPAEQRLAQLEAFWQPGAAGATALAGLWWGTEEARRTAAATLTMATGRPGLFAPRRLFGPLWEPFLNPEPSSLYDTTPLGNSLDRLIDFDLLNCGRPRFSVTAVDMESGDDVVFDTARHPIDIRHLRASSALLPAFPPVEVDGRLLGDGGVSVNLPLDVVLARPPAGRLLCISLDLLPLKAPRPKTLGDAASRMQDLMFATQSRRAVAAWQGIYDARVAGGTEAVPSVTLLQLAYADQGEEVSGKAFDFSPASARARWDAGHRDLAGALDQLRRGGIETGRPGLTVYKPDRAGSVDRPRLRIVCESLAPVEG